MPAVLSGSSWSGCRLDQRPCRGRIRASRPQRTCGAGQLHIEQRDLGADSRLAFGRAIGRARPNCLMTDGDQTGALVEGWYDDITLQAR
jgi:hypothetical protein